MIQRKTLASEDASYSNGYSNGAAAKKKQRYLTGCQQSHFASATFTHVGRTLLEGYSKDSIRTGKIRNPGRKFSILTNVIRLLFDFLRRAWVRSGL